MKILISTATYNEVSNCEPLISGIRKNLPSTDILFVDDNSPDGTGELIDRLIENDDKLFIIHRKGKLGLGTAHIEMMKFAIEKKYDLLITMDADYSHDPKHLGEMLENLKDHEFVIGSRFVDGGYLNYGPFRKLISLTANFLARIMVGINLKECTTSYRGYHIPLLERIEFELIKSDGYSFMVEMLYHTLQNAKSYTEFPIHFEDRQMGKSKINKIEILKSILNLLYLFSIRIRKKVSSL